MTVNSMSFFIFFLGMALVYYLPFLKKYQWMILLAASCLFYYFAGAETFLYLILATAATHCAALALDRLNLRQEAWNAEQKEHCTKEEAERFKAGIKAGKRRILVLDAMVTVGILAFVKYGDFIVENVNRIPGVEAGLGLTPLNLIVPLGISYYTLQSIGYVMDVSKGKVRAEKNILKTSLFLVYFPQITQGPIGRFPQLAPQLFGSHAFCWRDFSFGFQRVLWGFFKKTVISERMSPFVDEIFLDYGQYGGFTLLLGCIYFSVQAYMDFSAYMDIVAGFSQVLGIHLEENFRRPFFSQSLAEYWRRWHISLSSWFRDYVFYPLSLSSRAVKLSRLGRKFLPAKIAKLVPSVYAMLFVWFATGLWHDASWRYICWGVANGVIMISSLCLSDVFQGWKDRLHITEKNPAWNMVRIVRTFLLISLLKVFPAAMDLGGTVGILKKIFTDFHLSFSYQAWFPGLEVSHLAYILFGLLLCLLISIWQERKGSVREGLETKPFVLRWCLYAVVLCAILSIGALGSDLSGGFEYAQY